MNTNGPVYPRWEREGRVSRFFVGPSLSVYQVEEIDLIGGSIFAASASDKADLIGQFEYDKNAQKACARDFAQRGKVSAGETGGWGLNPRQTRG
jgi:hypothetical protein